MDLFLLKTDVEKFTSTNKKTLHLIFKLDMIHDWLVILLFVQDGSKIFTASCDKSAKMWDLASNQFVQVAQVHVTFLLLYVIDMSWLQHSLFVTVFSLCVVMYVLQAHWPTFEDAMSSLTTACFPGLVSLFWPAARLLAATCPPTRCTPAIFSWWCQSRPFTPVVDKLFPREFARRYSAELRSSLLC